MNKDRLFALLGEILSRRDEKIIITVTEETKDEEQNI
mgnify:CR=1 FL=1